MKIFKRKLWEILAVVFSALFVVISAGYVIAMNNSATVNNALNVTTSSIDRSDDEEYQYYPSAYSDYASLEADYLALAEEVEGEGLVLLRNENDALPLSEGEKVSAMLTGSVVFNYATSGSSSADTTGYTDFKTALEDEGLAVNETLWSFYEDKINNDGYGRYKQGTIYITNEVPYSEYTTDAISSIADYGTAIVNIARNSGEGADLTSYSTICDGLDGSCLSLTQDEVDVLEALTQMKEDGTVEKIIVILNSSATIQLDFLDYDGIDVDACMWIGNVGKGGISAVAKALTGEIVPSGKLSDTYLKDNFSSPAMAQQSYNNTAKSFMTTYQDSDSLTDDSQTAYGVYIEGIYVGYRYYETRYADYVAGSGNAGDYSYADDVAYSFGYGTSYTEFEYSDFAVEASSDGKTYEVSLTVTNAGKTYSGKETVEVYLQKPYTDYDEENGIEKAAAELVGYAKTEELAPGASVGVSIEITEDQFKSYDSEKAETYILDGGTYYLSVGNGAHDALNNILAKQGYTPDNTDGRMDAEGDEDFVFAVEKSFDNTTYSTASATGNEITNQLEFADLNKYEGSSTQVTYVSRSDWTWTWPTAKIEVSVTDQLYEDLQSEKAIEEDADAETPTYGASNGLNIAAMIGKDYDDEDWDALLDQMTYAEQSLLVTNGMYSTVVMESVGKPDTKENDGPTGVVDSEGSLSFPSEGIWASTYNDELIEKVGELLAEDARNSGVTGMYAVGINIHRMPFGGRSHEYFSEDPYLTGQAAIYEVAGMQSKGVISYVKHIAFNDQDDHRAGGSVWFNEQEAREVILKPFEYALSSEEGMGNAHGVMSAMNRAGAIWVGACSELLENIMRGEWAFDGACITDMAASNTAYIMNYCDGFMNGTDLYLSNGSSTALDSYNCATFAQQIRECSHRILYITANFSAAMNGISSDSAVNATSWWWSNLLIALEIVFGILAVDSIGLYGVSKFREYSKAKKGEE